MDSCIVYMVAAALEKCQRYGYQMDVIISSSPYPSFSNPVKRWGSSFAEPPERKFF